MNCCQLPDLGSLYRLDCCQACDMFPVDMGIDVGPLQARINECKRRYHREVWQILCDGANQQSRKGKYDEGREDDDEDDDMESTDLGGGTRPQDQRKRGGKRGTGGTPDTSTGQTSTNARPAGGRKERNQSRRRDGGRRHRRSVSIGGVSVSGEVGWTPIEAQLNELKTTLARAYRNGCSSKKKKKTLATASAASPTSSTGSATATATKSAATTMNSSALATKSATKTVSTSATKTVTTATPSAIKTATATVGSSESRNRQAHTLEFTLIADPTKPELSISGGNSFRTVAATNSSFVPLHCGDWGGTRQARTAATTATATGTASSRRRPRSRRRQREDGQTRATATKEASGCSRG